MASIKERAAALKLAEKLCVRPQRKSIQEAFQQASGLNSKTVQSFSLWSGLISQLRSCVTVKRRRVHFKSHSECFLGSEAADVVADYLNHAKGLEGAEVPRDKVVCVCQALMDCNVFEAVGTKVFGKDKNQDVFQDSKSALYRFVNVHMPSVDDLERVMLFNGIQKLFCSAPSDRHEEPPYPIRSLGQMPPSVKFIQKSIKTNQLSTATTASLSPDPVLKRLSPSPSRLKGENVLPQSLVDDVWQEETLLRLLNLVELPLLEGVLQCLQTPSSPAPHSNPDLIYSSSHLDRQIIKAFRDSQEDEWLLSALDCLDFLPDQPVVELSRELCHCFPQDQESCDQVAAGSSIQDVGKCLDGYPVQPVMFLSGPGLSDEQPQNSQIGMTHCKVLLYGALVKYYTHTDRSPLLPQCMTDIYTAIIDLLVNAKLGAALEALQLCLKLLPHSCREELRRLLTFMSLASDPEEIRLDKEMENKLAVKRSFSRAVLHSKTLSKEKEDLMVVFMLSNIEEIFKIPGALHKGVSDKLARLVQGKPPDMTGSMICQQVYSRTYTDATKTTTNQELRALLSNIHLDTKISAKERKRLLRQFNQTYPEIFNQYFGDSALSML